MGGKSPKLICRTGQEARELRHKFGLNQVDFWGQIEVTQSGGSRYESGRRMPDQVTLLLHLAYGTERQANMLLAHLRQREE
ncbi:helix-turn-helix domain-containing protein [Azonexus fungiphilus]